MNRESLESLDKESLIRLVLAQAETIAALTRQVEILTARVAELEARLGLPPKTPDNSSTPPSRGQKPSGEEKKIPDKRKAHPGAHRPLHPNPTSRRDVIPPRCVNTDEPEDLPIHALRQWVSSALRNLSYIGMIEPAYFVNVGIGPFKDLRPVSWHAHLLVWGCSKRELKNAVKVT